MTAKISIEKIEHLPMPLIYLASTEDLAQWQADQLRSALQKGERKPTISFFDTAPMGFDVFDAARIIIDALRSVLRSYPETEHLTILCGDDAALRACAAYLDPENAVPSSHAQ